MVGPARRADYVDPLGLLATTPVRLKPLAGDSGPRVGLVVETTKPGHRDVGVELGRGQGGMAEQFLHDPQIGAALQ